ncbi:MAG: hypothetical protein WCR56_04470 [Bacilli bacterium]|jgi:hypothetical protein
MTDLAICVSAVPYRMSINLVFQSVTDPKIFYHVRRDVVTSNLRKICFRPDNPPVFILKFNQKKIVRDIKYGFKNLEACQKEEKDLFYNKSIAGFAGQIFSWCILPVLLAVVFILILNCFYNWWWGWGEWFLPYLPK